MAKRGPKPYVPYLEIARMIRQLLLDAGREVTCEYLYEHLAPTPEVHRTLGRIYTTVNWMEKERLIQLRNPHFPYPQHRVRVISLTPAGQAWVQLPDGFVLELPPLEMSC